MAVTVKLELTRPLPETDELLARVERRVDGERRAEDPEWATFEFADEDDRAAAQSQLRAALDEEDPDWGEKLEFVDEDEEEEEEDEDGE